MYGVFHETDGYVDEIGTFTNPGAANDAMFLWVPTAVDPDDYNAFYLSVICDKHECSNGDTKYEDGAECEHSDIYEMPYEDPRPVEFFNNLTVR